MTTPNELLVDEEDEVRELNDADFKQARGASEVMSERLKAKLGLAGHGKDQKRGENVENR
ncbi:hypothetical protein HNP46_006098 [Pseudomonas nitritireducens]|uniref:Uncharacterized protein n=1 Tax=Pseudomonas nitroreducens TaxID=46680 RepID=A0A7W7P5D0_PSENT|nr:hypothetical protein [Pseudomonas nitritireducens]MBB4867187.1 hypothetical protein [Pseudomonas nitritireducens]